MDDNKKQAASLERNKQKNIHVLQKLGKRQNFDRKLIKYPSNSLDVITPSSNAKGVRGNVHKFEYSGGDKNGSVEDDAGKYVESLSNKVIKNQGSIVLPPELHFKRVEDFKFFKAYPDLLDDSDLEPEEPNYDEQALSVLLKEDRGDITEAPQVVRRRKKTETPSVKSIFDDEEQVKSEDGEKDVNVDELEDDEVMSFQMGDKKLKRVKVEADGNCGFRCVYGGLHIQGKFDRVRLMRALLGQILQYPSTTKTARIMELIVNDMEVLFHEYKVGGNGNNNDNQGNQPLKVVLPKVMLPKVMEIFESYSIDDILVLRESLLDKYVISEYLDYMAENDGRWPAINGLVHAVAELLDKEIVFYSENIKDKNVGVVLQFDRNNCYTPTSAVSDVITICHTGGNGEMGTYHNHFDLLEDILPRGRESKALLEVNDQARIDELSGYALMILDIKRLDNNGLPSFAFENLLNGKISVAEVQTYGNHNIIRQLQLLAMATSNRTLIHEFCKIKGIVGYERVEVGGVVDCKVNIGHARNKGAVGFKEEIRQKHHDLGEAGIVVDSNVNVECTRNESAAGSKEAIRQKPHDLGEAGIVVDSNVNVECTRNESAAGSKEVIRQKPQDSSVSRKEQKHGDVLFPQQVSVQPKGVDQRMSTKILSVEAFKEGGVKDMIRKIEEQQKLDSARSYGNKYSKGKHASIICRF